MYASQASSHWHTSPLATHPPFLLLIHLFFCSPNLPWPCHLIFTHHFFLTPNLLLDGSSSTYLSWRRCTGYSGTDPWQRVIHSAWPRDQPPLPTRRQTDGQTDNGDSVKIKVARLCLIDNDGEMSRGRLCAERPSPLVSPAINSLLLAMTQSITIQLNLLSVSCR